MSATTTSLSAEPPTLVSRFTSGTLRVWPSGVFRVNCGMGVSGESEVEPQAEAHGVGAGPRRDDRPERLRRARGGRGGGGRRGLGGRRGRRRGSGGAGG